MGHVCKRNKTTEFGAILDGITIRNAMDTTARCSTISYVARDTSSMDSTIIYMERDTCTIIYMERNFGNYYQLRGE